MLQTALYWQVIMNLLTVLIFPVEGITMYLFTGL